MQAAAGSAPQAQSQQGPSAAACVMQPAMLNTAAGQPGASGGPPSVRQMLTPADQALLAQIRMTTNLKADREASAAAAAAEAAPMAAAAMATAQTQIRSIGQQTPAGTTAQQRMSGLNTSSPAQNAATVSAAQQPQPGKAVASLPFQNRPVGPGPPQPQVSAAPVSAQPEFLLQKKRGRPRSDSSTKERPAQSGTGAPPASNSARLDAVNAATALQLQKPQGSQLAPNTFHGPQHRPAGPQQRSQTQQQLRPQISGAVPPQAALQAAQAPVSQNQLNGYLLMALKDAQAQAATQAQYLSQSQRVAPAGIQALPAGWCPRQLPMQRAQLGASSTPAQRAPAPAAMQVPPQTQSAQGLQQAPILAPRPTLIQPGGQANSASLAHVPGGQAVRTGHYIAGSPSAGGNSNAAQPASLIRCAGPAAPTVGPSPATGQRQPPQSPFTQAQPAAGSSGRAAGQKRAAQAPAAPQSGPPKRPHTEQPHTPVAQPPIASSQHVSHPPAQLLGSTSAASGQPAPAPPPEAVLPALALPLPRAVGEEGALAGLRASVHVRLRPWQQGTAPSWLHCCNQQAGMQTRAVPCLGAGKRCFNRKGLLKEIHAFAGHSALHGQSVISQTGGEHNGRPS